MSKTISQLPIASTVASADVFPLDQGGLTKQATLSVIAAGLPSATGTGGLVRQGYPVFSTGFATNAINGISNSGAYSVVGGASFGASGGGFVNLYGGTHATNPGLLQLGTNGNGIINVLPSGNVGIGTNTPQERLHVAGDVRIDNNGNLQFTDTAGTNPQFVCQGDNNFVLYGTNSIGVLRPIMSCLMRSDISPLTVSAPIEAVGTIQIGVSGSPIQNVISAVFNHTPAAIAANGGVQTLDVPLTGATVGSVTTIECPGGVSNNAIILKANYISANTIRVYWINPTAASVTLSNANYRIVVINF
jgi:hypothetical protein